MNTRKSVVGRAVIVRDLIIYHIGNNSAGGVPLTLVSVLVVWGFYLYYID